MAPQSEQQQSFSYFTYAAHILNTSVHPPPNTSPSRCSLASLSPLSSPSHSLRPPRAATPAPSSAATALRRLVLSLYRAQSKQAAYHDIPSLTLLRAPLSSPSSGSSSATSPGASVSAARRSPSSALARAPAQPAPSAARTTTSYVSCLAFVVCSSISCSGFFRVA